MGAGSDALGDGALSGGGPSGMGGVGRDGKGRGGGNDSDGDYGGGLHQQRTANTATVTILHDMKGAVSLLDMTVRTVRLALSRRFALTRGIPGVASAGAAWPPIWPTTGTAAPMAPADITTVPDHHLRAMGLSGLEERWRRSIPGESPDAWTPAEINRIPAWLHPRPPAGAGPSERDTRAARRTALRTATPTTQPVAAPAIQLSSDVNNTRHDFGGVWTRLCDPTLPRPARVTCWSILHATLGCNAFTYHVRQGGQPHGHLPDSARWCTAPACFATGTHETLTHAFLDCPDAAPAIDWLLDAWQALSAASQRLPKSALLLLGDDPEAWPPDLAPADPKTYRLWTRLRVHIIGAIWRVRCSRAEVTIRHSSFARRVVSTAVEQLIDSIQRDWARTQQDLRTMASGAFCQQWWRGRDTQIDTSAFIKQWATPELLCKVSGGNNDTPLALELLIGLDKPIRFPD